MIIIYVLCGILYFISNLLLTITWLADYQPKSRKRMLIAVVLMMLFGFPLVLIGSIVLLICGLCEAVKGGTNGR